MIKDNHINNSPNCFQPTVIVGNLIVDKVTDMAKSTKIAMDIKTYGLPANLLVEFKTVLTSLGCYNPIPSPLSSVLIRRSSPSRKASSSMLRRACTLS